MKDWNCFTQNTYTLVAASFTQDFFPMKIDVYSEVPGYTLTNLVPTFFNVIALANNLVSYT